MCHKRNTYLKTKNVCHDLTRFALMETFKHNDLEMSIYLKSRMIIWGKVWYSTVHCVSDAISEDIK